MPSTCSIATNTSPSASPTSWTAITFGCASFASRARFFPQLLARAGASQHFQRDAAIELGIVGCIDHAHATGPESRVEHVAAERAGEPGVGGIRRFVVARRLQLRERGDELLAARARVEMAIDAIALVAWQLSCHVRRDCLFAGTHVTTLTCSPVTLADAIRSITRRLARCGGRR
jgi:hypothetical protein